jgi:hypothetical protein
MLTMSNTSDSNKDFADDEWTIERTLDELFGKREVIPDKREELEWIHALQDQIEFLNLALKYHVFYSKCKGVNL